MWSKTYVFSSCILQKAGKEKRKKSFLRRFKSFEILRKRVGSYDNSAKN